MPAGRPPEFKTPEEMQAAIDEYFSEDGDAYMGMGEDRIFAPTISGLAFHLGLSRQSLCNYEKKDEFLDTIKRAKSRVEIALEQRLFGQAVTGTIFNLKNNFGWKDKTETEHTAPDGPITQVERIIVQAPN